MAGILDDTGGNGDERFNLERNGADEHAHALGDGGRRVPDPGAHAEGSEVRHAVDCDSGVERNLRAIGVSYAGAAPDRVYVAANRSNDSDRDGWLEAAPNGSGDEAAVPDSLGTRGDDLCCGGAAVNERCGSGGKRPLCAAVGTCSRVAGASGGFPAPEGQIPARPAPTKIPPPTQVHT